MATFGFGHGPIGQPLYMVRSKRAGSPSKSIGQTVFSFRL